MKCKADLIAEKNPRWISVKESFPKKKEFVRWLSSDGIVVYRTLCSMADLDCFGKKATTEFKLLYWRPLKKKINDKKTL